MGALKLAKDVFLLPTPSGAYYAVSTEKMDKTRRFLNNLFIQPVTPKLTVEQMIALSGGEDEDKALELLRHCQKLGWVQGIDKALSAPKNSLEDILPDLLKNISETGKVLLADDQGFYLACSGFTHETAEELSALSAELGIVHKRRSGLLFNNLGLGSQAWSIVDAFGNSQIGFWPIFIGKHRFVIAISGIPHFNQKQFIDLIWALSMSYAIK